MLKICLILRNQTNKRTSHPRVLRLSCNWFMYIHMLSCKSITWQLRLLFVEQINNLNSVFKFHIFYGLAYFTFAIMFILVEKSCAIFSSLLSFDCWIIYKYIEHVANYLWFIHGATDAIYVIALGVHVQQQKEDCQAKDETFSDECNLMQYAFMGEQVLLCRCHAN